MIELWSKPTDFIREMERQEDFRLAEKYARIIYYLITGGGDPMKSVDLDLHNALAKIGEAVVGLVRESGLLRRKRRAKRAKRRVKRAAPKPRTRRSRAASNGHATPPGAMPAE